MPPIRIYTTAFCPYCHSAKRLLETKKAAFEEFDLTGDRAGRRELVAMSNGRTTVPQIWIGDRHVGGCDDLYALDAAGELDRLLSA